jgi:hypothetical protein
VLAAIFLAGLEGAPPPDEHALAVTTLGLWLFVPWGWWVDRHREPVTRDDASGKRASRPLAHA